MDSFLDAKQDYKLPEHAAEAVAKYHEGHFLGAQIKVEISHAKSGAKSAPVNGECCILELLEDSADPIRVEEGRIVVRNPPGSDRPSDTRKPMHINGPPNAQFESSSRYLNL